MDRRAESDEIPAIRERSTTRRPERLLTCLVRGKRQRGVISAAELRVIGFTPSGVSRLVSEGRLHPLYPGIYSLDDPPRRLARELGALRYLGTSAALSHLSAAFAWGAVTVAPWRVEVTLPSQRRTPGMRAHRGRLKPTEVRVRHGLRVTSPVRTAFDLAATCELSVYGRAINELIALRLTTASELQGAAERLRGRRGTDRLRRLLAVGATPMKTRYEGEDRLAELLHGSARLPTPERNVFIEGWEVDFLWRDAAFFVEMDGGAAHMTPRKFESDRRRDAEFQLLGLVGQRVTWAQITRTGPDVLARIERGYDLAAARVTKFPSSGRN